MDKYICFKCGKEFIGKSSCHIYKFCSRECYRSSDNCAVGKGKSPRGKEKILRTGYWYIYLPSHPNSGKQGYIAEHRLIMEKHIGRMLEKTEIVHHIDKNPINNELDNLVLCSGRKEHSKLHPEIAKKLSIDYKGKHHSPSTEFKKGMIPWNKPSR